MPSGRIFRRVGEYGHENGVKGMNGIALVYFLLGGVLCFGARLCPRGTWNEEYTSRNQTKVLTGMMALLVILHHMAQKISAAWSLTSVRSAGLEFFTGIGFPVVAVFFFCSGLGLYRSLHGKPDYLKGFLRRRVLLIVIAYYLSEWIYTAVRLLMGQRMALPDVLWYLSGLRMANTYSWYAVVIPFFYLVFWAAFRFCRREGTAIFWVFAFTLAYTVLGTLVNHQNTWWMRGEWWYNSVVLFPLGLLFGKNEARVTRFFRRGYWIWLLLSAAATVLLFIQSDWLLSHRWGYYWESSRMRVPFRLYSVGCQWLVCCAFVAFCFLLMMKVRLGNGALAWMGAMSLELYLVHGLFVELFGYRFMDLTRSFLYIRNAVPYMAAVLACSVPAALGFRWIYRKVHGLLTGEAAQNRPRGRVKAAAAEAVRRLRARCRISGETVKKVLRYGWLPALLVLGFVGIRLFSGGTPACVVDRLKITIPAGFSQSYTDSRYTKWKYTGKDRKPSDLMLDRDIRGESAQRFANVEAVMEACSGWMTDMEIYVNPQGIRMARGFSQKNDYGPDRRYYVEGTDGVFLLTMIEDSRYYDPADCEAVMQEVADSICVSYGQ